MKNRLRKRWQQLHSSGSLSTVKVIRDRAATLGNIEKNSFTDVPNVEITLDNTLPVKDVRTILYRTACKLLIEAGILDSKSNWQKGRLLINLILDILDCTPLWVRLGVWQHD